MPVHFKGTSEYDTNYKWFDSFKSRSFSPEPEQIMDPAGKPSVKIYTSVEPPLQHKKRLDGPATSLSADYFVVPTRPAPEFTLLGQQEKFASNVKYQMRQPSPGKKMYKNKENFGDDAPPSKQLKMQKRAKPVAKDRNQLVRSEAHPENAKSDLPSPPPAPRETKEAMKDKDLKDILGGDAAPAVSKSVDVSGPSVNKGVSKTGQKGVSKSVDTTATKKGTGQGEIGSKPGKPRVSMNESVQTNLKKGVAVSAPEAPANYALQYKAGVAPGRPLWKSSEYQKQFQWRKGMKASPLIAAQEIVHKSNADLGPYKTDGVPRLSEYNRQYLAWNPQLFNTDLSLYQKDSSVTKKDAGESQSSDKGKSKRSKSAAAPVERKSQSGQETQQVVDESKQVKSKLTERHGKLKKQGTEYRMNFKSPTRFSYEKGAWRGAMAPQMFAPTVGDGNSNNNNMNAEDADMEGAPLSNWFAEVLELRRRANEYRQRAQGTHFSRQHLLQLMAGQAQCWDTASDNENTNNNARDAGVSDNIRALDLHLRPAAGKRSPVARDAATDGCSHQATQDSSEVGENEALEDDRDTEDTEANQVEEEVARLPEKRGRSRKKAAAAAAPEKSRKMAWLEKDRAAINSQARALERENQRQTDKYNGEGAEDDTEQVEGRLPTPVLKRVASPDMARRHHLDLTTPSVGGAILSCPASKESKMIVTSRSGDSYVTASDDFPQSSQQKKSYNLDLLVTAPLLGQPSGDTHPLRDDECESDRPLKTRYVVSPGLPEDPADDEDKENTGAKPQRAQAKRGRSNNKASRPSKLSAVQEDFSKTWSHPGLEAVREKRLAQAADDDALSVSVMSVASSASLASEILERAKQRQDFWNQGRSGGGSAKA